MSAASTATVELSAQLAQTRAFVAYRPLSVAFRRPADADGEDQHSFGDVDALAPVLAPQTVRLVDVTGGQSLQSTTPNMSEVGRYRLIGMPALDVQPNDFWDADGGRYLVTLVQPANGYETRADVVFRKQVQ